MDRITLITILAAGSFICLAAFVIIVMVVELTNPVSAAIAGAVFASLAIKEI